MHMKTGKICQLHMGALTLRSSGDEFTARKLLESLSPSSTSNTNTLKAKSGRATYLADVIFEVL